MGIIKATQGFSPGEFPLRIILGESYVPEGSLDGSSQSLESLQILGEEMKKRYSEKIRREIWFIFQGFPDEIEELLSPIEKGVIEEIIKKILEGYARILSKQISYESFSDGRQERIFQIGMYENIRLTITPDMKSQIEQY